MVNPPQDKRTSQGAKKRPLMISKQNDRSALPPTATTLLLESLLENKGNKKKKKTKKRRISSTSASTSSGVQLSSIPSSSSDRTSSLISNPFSSRKSRILSSTRGLDEAPRLFQKKNLPQQAKTTKKKQKKATKQGLSTGNVLAAAATATCSSTSTTTMAPTMGSLENKTTGNHAQDIGMRQVQREPIESSRSNAPSLGLKIGGLRKRSRHGSLNTCSGQSQKSVVHEESSKSYPPQSTPVASVLQPQSDTGAMSTLSTTESSKNKLLNTQNDGAPGKSTSTTTDPSESKTKNIISESSVHAHLDKDTTHSSTISSSSRPTSLATREASFLSKSTFATATRTTGIPILSSSSSHSSALMNDTSTGTSTTATTKRRPTRVNNDNFVRLNLRNSAGACRGARKKAKPNKWKSKYNNREHERDGGAKKSSSWTKTSQQRPAYSSGIDPLDDYADGAYRARDGTGSKSASTTAGTAPSSTSSNEAPICARHSRPCKLLKVKHNKKGNKGRQFYVCSLPRGQQCDFFAWAADTFQEAQRALLRNSSYTGFVARQVAAYGERFRCLTVPELRVEAKKRRLDCKGKRQELLTRLSLWVRDEVVALERGKQTQEDGSGDVVESAPVPDAESPLPEEAVEEDSDDDESEESSSSSDEELELYHPEELDTAVNPSSDEYSVANAFVDNGKESDDDNEEEDSGLPSIRRHLKRVFGHDDFRDGQEWAIQRCLDRQRTLLVAPTGFGKSLCYAMPASLMDGVCIVVSPLISLMQDQLRQLPPRIPATTLSGSMTAAAMVSTIDDVLRGRIKILFVSPERLASPSFRRLFRYRWNPETNTRERQFPTVSLLCVDEAHCMSQWGHNFRPSYLRLRSLIEYVQPQSVLAMTATAGPRVVKDICRSLCIPMEQAPEVSKSGAGDASLVDRNTRTGLHVLKCDRDNIDVACRVVDTEEQRLVLLFKMLQSTKEKNRPRQGQSIEDLSSSDPFSVEGSLSKGSTIVYVWRQRDAEVVAENLISFGVEGGVVVYHGGMDASARSKAQSKFMRGKARVCVATVAFGMGINKADVKAVVHLYLPASPEHYLQEIGRAGRDGRPATAVSLILRDEVVLRHSLAHSDLLSSSQIKELIRSVRDLVVASKEEISEQLQKQQVTLVPTDFPILIALPLDSMVRNVDCKPETVETVLSLIEEMEPQNPLLKIEGSLMDKVSITLKRQILSKLAVREQIAQCILSCGTCLDSPDGRRAVGNEDEEAQTLQKQFLAYSFGTYEFSVTRCALLLGPAAGPRHVFAALRRLQNIGELELVFNPSGKALQLLIEPRGVSFFCGPDDLLDGLGERIANQSGENVASVAQKARDAHGILQRVSKVTSSCSAESKSPSLCLFQDLISQYFTGKQLNLNCDDEEDLPLCVPEASLKEIRVDTFMLLRDLPLSEQFQVTCLPLDRGDRGDYTALALAKFLHGIESPRAPYSAFRHHMLYGKWRQFRFPSLRNAVHEILRGSIR